MENILTLPRGKSLIVYKHTLALKRIIFKDKEEKILKEYCKALNYKLYSHNGLILLTYKNRSGYIQRSAEGELIFVNQIKIVKKGLVNIKESISECLAFFVWFKHKGNDFLWSILFKNGAFNDVKNKNGNIDVRKLYGLKFLEDNYEC